MKTETLNLAIAPTSQGILYEEILRAEAGGRKHKLRISIKSDSYRNQCHARLERWDDAKWQGVAAITPSAMATREGLHHLRDRGGMDATHFKADRDELVRQAALILDE